MRTSRVEFGWWRQRGGGDIDRDRQRERRSHAADRQGTLPRGRRANSAYGGDHLGERFRLSRELGREDTEHKFHRRASGQKEIQQSVCYYGMGEDSIDKILADLPHR